MSREIVKQLSVNSLLIKDTEMKCPNCGEQLYHPSFQEAIGPKGEFYENWLCDTECGFDGLWDVGVKKWNKKWEKRKK